MKIYLYGDYISHNGRYVRVNPQVTLSLQEAFNECYLTGLDGEDYWLVLYDTDTDQRKSISIQDRNYTSYWDRAKQNSRKQNQDKAMRAEYV